MPIYNSLSRCCGQVDVVFRWFDGASDPPENHVSAAVEVLFAAVSGQRRVWNPYAAQMARSEFKKRISRAERGDLEPVDEVKPIDIRNPPPLYEIRWQDLPVTNRDAEGRITHTTVLVRMYHSEPDEAPGYFIGHHAHEKEIDVENVNAGQQVEIEKAKEIFDLGAAILWGIASAA